mmetsp:Transcript_10410/g.31824  ORF Transcript_10410/g.31824 Transcript_10410/m.31824 type:complete len:211 (+) Transcript_10410:390-1022(+)
MSDGEEDIKSPDQGETEKKAGVEEVPSDYDDNVTAEEAREAKQEGNRLYGEEKWDESAMKYTHALRCPHVDPQERAIFYCNRAASRIKTKDYTGVVHDCQKSLKLKPGYAKALLRRKQACVELEDYGKAIQDLNELINSGADGKSKREYEVELRRLTALKAEKEEKQKAEAMAQLKELGNSFLSMFGMSTDNFKFEKDPNTGSYSVKMNQ